MGDLDRVDPGRVQRRDDPADVGGVDPVTDRVHPVAQRDVLDVELGHRVASWSAGLSRPWAIDSPTASAAEVMMSRLPA